MLQSNELSCQRTACALFLGQNKPTSSRVEGVINEQVVFTQHRNVFYSSPFFIFDTLILPHYVKNSESSAYHNETDGKLE